MADSMAFTAAGYAFPQPAASKNCAIECDFSELPVPVVHLTRLIGITSDLVFVEVQMALQRAAMKDLIPRFTQ
jgi:hypothetical protein